MNQRLPGDTYDAMLRHKLTCSPKHPSSWESETVRLKYPAYYRRAALYWILSAALLAVFGFAIYLIFVEHGFDAVPSDARNSAYVSLFFILISALYLAIRGFFLISAGRRLRRIWRDNTPQPVFSGGWSGEEVITVTRIYPRGAGWIFLLFGAAAFFTFGTPAIAPAISALIEITVHPSNPTTLDPPKILATLAPVLPFILLLIAFSLLIGAVAAVLSNSYSRITADERGVTVKSRRRTRRIIWDEIMLFVRLTRSEYPEVAGSYALLGNRKFITFNISDVQEAAPTNVNNRSSANRSASQFEGGYPQYAKDARRLIERIHRRTGLELRDISSALLPAEHHAFAALEALTVSELTSAPVAEESPQPSPNTQSSQMVVELVTHLSWRSRLRGILASAAVTGGIVAIMSMPLLADQFVYHAHPDDILAIVLIGLTILVALMAIVFSLVEGRRKQQAVAATESALKSQGLSGVVIPWGEIRAWGVLPAASDRKQPTIYAVMSETRSIIWSEPEDAELDGTIRNNDRRAAYRIRAAQLHAAIAARTGLPLREIRLESDVTASA
jgi:hypothetical protein